MEDDISFRGRVAPDSRKDKKIRMFTIIFVLMISCALTAGIAYGLATGFMVLFAMLWIMWLARFITRSAMNDWEAD